MVEKEQEIAEKERETEEPEEKLKPTDDEMEQQESTIKPMPKKTTNGSHESPVTNKLATVEEAQRVRRALHNVVCPETKPKSLSIQYTTKEQCDRYSAGLAPVAETRSIDRERPVISLKRDPEPVSSTPSASTRNITMPGGRQTLKITVETNVRDNENTAVRHVERAREKERERDRDAKRDSTRRKRSATTPHRRDDVKRDLRERSRSRQVDVDEPHAKTLEGLFKKTVAQPAIYYLPLTDEQAAKRAEEKATVEKARQEERERREKERAGRRRSRSRCQPGASCRRVPARLERDVTAFLQPSDEDEQMAGSYLICNTGDARKFLPTAVFGPTTRSRPVLTDPRISTASAVVLLVLLVLLEMWTAGSEMIDTGRQKAMKRHLDRRFVLGGGYGLYITYYRLTVTSQQPPITTGVHQHVQLVVVVKNGDMTQYALVQPTMRCYAHMHNYTLRSVRFP
ncbi:unnamed protein product, partial [Mesorhabditis spiculigera]